MRTTSWVLAMAICGAACGGGGDGMGGADAAPGGGDASGACDPAAGPCAYAHAFPPIEIAGGEENERLCQSWTLHNPTELWVNAVDFGSDGAYHHSNWFYVPDTELVNPDGFWTCADSGFDELVAALLGGFLFAQSTQITGETQQFPTGAAIRIPPYSRVIGSTHLLNYNDETVQTAANMTIHTIPEPSVTTKLTPFRMTYHDLHIPTGGKSEFSSSCDIANTYANTIHQPTKFKLYYVLSHYHSLGSNFRLTVHGGGTDGVNIHERDENLSSDTMGRAFDPPLELDDIGQLEFGCTFDNMRGAEVGWGIGDQEMCVMAGFAESDMAFDASVGDGTGEMVGVDGDVTKFTGPCNMLAFPWEHDKEGGVGP